MSEQEGWNGLEQSSYISYPTLAEKIVLYLTVVTIFTDTKASYYALIALAVLWIYNKRYTLTLTLLKKSSIFLSLALFIGYLILSLAYSENLAYGIRALEKKSALIFLPILFTGIPWNNKLRSEVFRLYVASIFILTIYSLVSTFLTYKIESDFSYFSWVLPLTSSFGANYYALFLGYAILVLVFDFKHFRKFLPPIVIVGLILYFACFMALLSSRSAIAALLLIVLAFAIREAVRNKGKQRLIGFSILLVTVLASVTIFTFVPYLNSRVKQALNFSADPRYQLFRANLNLFLDNPVMGVGIGDVQDKMTEAYHLANYEEAYLNKYNAHNDWLQISVATGFVGLILFFNFFLRLARKAWISKDIYMISFVIFYTIVSMTESILERNKGVIFVSFFVTFFFILKRPSASFLDVSSGQKIN